ncbi:hypothetical protein [Halolamina sediminis]|uniref:hypothetical protein n=1 Tax=Halolamina sediminis TaxID=1480675 RepID=UPI0012ABECCC|nr:hypothetical protein [Halolamina sediminis]
MGLFSSDDNKPHTTKKNWHKSPTEIQKGGYKLHITGKHYIVAIETPDGALVLFEDWEGVLAHLWRIVPSLSFGSTNFKELEKRADRRVSGLPRCNLRADWDYTMQDSFIPDTATIEMKDDEIIIPPQNKTAKDLLLPIKGTKITEKELNDFSNCE